jgi:hypothetical protein
MPSAIFDRLYPWDVISFCKKKGIILMGTLRKGKCLRAQERLRWGERKSLMKLSHKKNLVLLTLFFVFTFCFTLQNSIAALNEIDREEQKGNLNPKETMIRSYKKGSENEENYNHVRKVSLHYLRYAEKSYLLCEMKSDTPSKDFAKAIGAAFVWICTAPDSSVFKVLESMISKLIDKGFLSHDDLWIDDIPKIKITYYNGAMGIEDVAAWPPRFNMLPSQFKGKKLCIGGNRKDFPSDKYYLLDIDYEKKPDVVGNALNPRHIKLLPSSFDTIEFDHLGHTLLLEEYSSKYYGKGLLEEYYRILNKNGNFIFRTEHHEKKDTQDIYKNNKDKIKKTLKKIGFHDIEIMIKEGENSSYSSFYLSIIAYK